MMMKKETAAALVAALQEVAALEGRRIGFDGRFGRLTDRCDRSITTRIGWFHIPTVEEFLQGLHYEIKESRKCTYYGADNNESWTVQINGYGYKPWRSSYGVEYPALNEESALALIKKLQALADQARAFEQN